MTSLEFVDKARAGMGKWHLYKRERCRARTCISPHENILRRWVRSRVTLSSVGPDAAAIVWIQKLFC